MKRKILLIFLASLILNFSLSCTKAPGTSLKGLSSYLPDSDEVHGWIKARESDEYIGEDLFQYINGGAEIYHEYGFRRVVVQDYRNSEDISISVEIFEMTNPESAYGIYTFKSSPEGKIVSIGADGKLESYYMNFWRDSLLVTLTGFDEDKETVDGLIAIGRAVDKKIRTSKDDQEPYLVRLLPEEGLKKDDLKYVKGYLGLYNLYPFSTKDAFLTSDGIKGMYDQGYEIIILSYPNTEISLQAYKNAESVLKQESRYLRYKDSDNFFWIEDQSNKIINFASYQEYMIVILQPGPQETDPSSHIFDLVKDHIEKQK